MSQILTFLPRFDVFGQTISFNFRKEEKYKTQLGGCTSLAMIALIISFFYSSIINFFARTQVTSTTVQTFHKSPPALNFNQDQFMLAFQIEQSDFTTNPYFNITLEQRHYQTSMNGSQTRHPTINFDLVPCTMEHFSPIFERYGIDFTEQFNKNSLSTFICPVLNKSTSLTMGGAYTSSDYHFLKISVISCKNQTGTSGSLWRPTCPSTDQIQTFINSSNNIRFKMFSTNYVKIYTIQIINPQRAKDPIVPYLSLDQFNSFVPDKQFVQSDIFWRTSSVTTDDGIFMVPQEQTIEYGVREYGDFREQSQSNQLQQGYYAAFYPQKSPFQSTIQRSFLKFDTLHSYLGGFLQIVIVIVGIVMKFYNYQHSILNMYLVIVSMANDLFDLNNTVKKNVYNQLLFQTQQGRQKLKQQHKDIQGQNMADIPLEIPLNLIQNELHGIKKESYRDMNIQQGQISIKNTPHTNNSPQTKVSLFQLSVSKYFREFKTLISNKNQIGISFKFIISEILGRDDFLDDNGLLLKKATSQIQKELDVVFIFQQLYEFEKMKQVIFSKEQTELFNFNQKPVIQFQVDKKKRRSTTQIIILSRLVSMYREDELDNQELKRFNNLVNAYNSITTLDMDQITQEQIRFNTRLISLLGRQIPQLIESEIANFPQQEQSFNREDLVCNKQVYLQDDIISPQGIV